jgi:hypothetical protein
MNSSSRFALAAALALTFTAASADPAQADPMFGVRFGLYTNVSDPFLGGEMLFRIIPDLYLNPNLEVVLGHGRYLTFNADVHYDVAHSHHTFVWIGGGLAVINTEPEGASEGNTDVGFNLLLGIGGRHGRVIPYAQAKVILKDDSEFVIGVGLRF